ncbi:MAG: hypothetical protein DRI32_02345, partial [Chloroflexi bacterium]
MATKRRKPSKKNNAKKKKEQIIYAVIAFIVILAAFFIFGGNSSPTTNSLPAEINTGMAYQKVEEGAFLLDVRTQEEWIESHVEGATLIPLDELEARISEVPTDREVVVICHSGNRAKVGRDI